MNCDQVFDALTRGPFPTGNDAHDERVERHLGHCGGCRRLAAALQPAVELFEEAVSPEESCGLPAYWGELFNQSDAPRATRTRTPKLLRRRTAARSRPSAAIRLEHAWRIAAALLVGMAIGGVMRAALQEPAHSGKLVASNDRELRPNLARWNALGMTAACGPMATPAANRTLSAMHAGHGDAIVGAGVEVAPRDDSPAAGQELSRQKCCTECHRSGGAVQVAATTRVRIASSCELCHVDQAAISSAAGIGGGD